MKNFRLKNSEQQKNPLELPTAKNKKDPKSFKIAVVNGEKKSKGAINGNLYEWKCFNCAPVEPCYLSYFFVDGGELQMPDNCPFGMTVKRKWILIKK